MKAKIIFFVLGFFSACIIGIGGIIAFLFLATSDSINTFHEKVLPSGKAIKVTMFTLAWGIDHSDRYANQDCFLLEYVSSSPHPDAQARDKETLEVFELLRPISEEWGFKRAEIKTLPTPVRRGTYYLYNFERNAEGKWTHTQEEMKVHIND